MGALRPVSPGANTGRRSKLERYRNAARLFVHAARRGQAWLSWRNEHVYVNGRFQNVAAIAALAAQLYARLVGDEDEEYHTDGSSTDWTEARPPIARPASQGLARTHETAIIALLTPLTESGALTWERADPASSMQALTADRRLGSARLDTLLDYLTSGGIRSMQIGMSRDPWAEYEQISLADPAGLSAGHRGLLAIGSLRAELNNGGFDQYFFNSAGDLAPIALEAAEQAGQAELASLIRQALELLHTGDPTNRTARQEALARLDRSSPSWGEGEARACGNVR